MTTYTYKFRIYPNVSQQQKLIRQFGMCRFVYNHYLAKRLELYKETGKGSTYFKDSADLTKLRKEMVWLKEANCQSLHQELRCLAEAYDRFFKKISGFPRFHKKGVDKQSFRVPQHARLEENRLVIPKFKEGIPIRLHRDVEGRIGQTTIFMNKSGQFYAMICVNRDMPRLRETTESVGVDLGIKTLVTCSNGKSYLNIKVQEKRSARLRRLHQSLDRKKKGSHNYERAKRKLAEAYRRVSDIRSNYLHQVSRSLINENQVIVLETLDVEGMISGGQMTRRLYDVSLSELNRQITYKAAWYGREVVRIDRWFPSSKTCHACRKQNNELKLRQRIWKCPACGELLDRDLNAARNILDEGLRIKHKTVGATGLACGEDVRPPKGGRPQRSTEVVSTMQDGSPQGSRDDENPS